MFSTPTRRLAWVVALLAVLCVGFFSYFRERRYATAYKAVEHTLGIQHAIADTLSLIKDAETGQRGFLLTRDPAYLGPHLRAQQAIPEQLSRLRRLVSANPDQVQSVAQLERLSLEKLGELVTTIELARQDRLDEALAMMREGRGRRIMLAIREECARMQSRESAELASREQHAEHQRRAFGVGLGVSWLLFLVVVGAGALSTARGVREAHEASRRLEERERALRALADEAGDLVRIDDVSGSNAFYVSPSCTKILGFSPDELRVLPPVELLHPDERAAVLELSRSADASAEGALVVHRLKTKGGGYRWFETIVKVARDPYEGVHLTSRDVTERKLAEDALRRQTHRLESILSSIGDGVVVMDPARTLVSVNPVAAEFFPGGEGATVEKDWARSQGALLPDGVTPFPSERGPLTRALRGEACDNVELYLRDRQGNPRLLSVTSRPLLDGPEQLGCVAVYRDITDARSAEREVQESEQRLRVLSEASFEGVAITRHGVVLDTNEVFAEALGYAPYELIGVDGLSLFAPEDHAHVRAMSAQSGVVYEAQMLRKDGSRFPAEVRGGHTTFRGESVRIAVVRDITERRRREAELKTQTELLRSMSLRDELTGLYNRRGFQEHAEQLLRTSTRTKEPVSLFFIDLNGMKAINDTLGHELGDRALTATGRLLQRVFREADVVARLGGDEFAVMAAQCGRGDVAHVVRRLEQQAQELNHSGSEQFQLSPRVGSAVFAPGSPLELSELLESADRSMYENKRAKKQAEARLASAAVS